MWNGSGRKKINPLIIVVVKFIHELKNISFKKISILDFLPWINDCIRREDEMAQKKIQSFITEVNESLPFPVILVLVLPSDEIVDSILNNV